MSRNGNVVLLIIVLSVISTTLFSTNYEQVVCFSILSSGMWFMIFSPLMKRSHIKK